LDLNKVGGVFYFFLKNIFMKTMKCCVGKKIKMVLLFAVSIFTVLHSYAQSGTAGINSANTQVRSYFAAGTNLMYAIGAIVGLILCTLTLYLSMIFGAGWPQRWINLLNVVALAEIILSNLKNLPNFNLKKLKS